MYIGPHKNKPCIGAVYILYPTLNSFQISPTKQVFPDPVQSLVKVGLLYAFQRLRGYHKGPTHTTNIAM